MRTGGGAEVERWRCRGGEVRRCDGGDVGSEIREILSVTIIFFLKRDTRFRYG